MKLQHLTNIIYISFFTVTISSYELPRIALSEGYGLNPSIKSSRALETVPLHYSLMHKTAAVKANMGEDYYTKRNTTTRDENYMIITISSNETGFLAPYDHWGPLGGFTCDPMYCSFEGSSLNYRNPWVMGNASRINLNTSLSIAYGAWELQTSALFFTEAQENYIYRGTRVIGWIGLGTSSGAHKNFQTENPIFSIIYNMTSSTGNLIFGFNSSLADISKPAMTVTATPNWEMEMVSVSVGGRLVYSMNDLEVMPIMFDLMSVDAAMPKEIAFSIFYELSPYLSNCYEIYCTSETLEGLPDIAFTLADNTQLSLSPEVYMHKLEDQHGLTGYYTIDLLNRRRNDKSLDYIVFGRTVLAHFYTVFQQQDQVNTITLYSLALNTTIAKEIEFPMPRQSEKEKAPISEASNKLSVLFYLGLSLACLCFVGLLIFIRVKISKEKKSQSQSMEESYQNKTFNLELSESDGDGIPLKPE